MRPNISYILLGLFFAFGSLAAAADPACSSIPEEGFDAYVPRVSPADQPFAAANVNNQLLAQACCKHGGPADSLTFSTLSPIVTLTCKDRSEIKLISVKNEKHMAPLLVSQSSCLDYAGCKAKDFGFGKISCLEKNAASDSSFPAGCKKILNKMEADVFKGSKISSACGGYIGSGAATSDASGSASLFFKIFLSSQIPNQRHPLVIMSLCPATKTLRLGPNFFLATPSKAEEAKVLAQSQNRKFGCLAVSRRHPCC